MDIENIVTKIPNIMSTIFDKIYIAEKNQRVLCEVSYNGMEIIVNKILEYSYLEEALKGFPGAFNEIDTNETVEKINGTNILTIKTVDSYKFIFIQSIGSVNVQAVNLENDKLILVADDSPIITSFFSKAVGDEYKVLVAHNGDEAIKVIEENKDKLYGAFVDLQMPIKSGYDVLEYFKANNLFTTIPITIITGEEDGDKVTNILNTYQVVDLLNKPFSNTVAKEIVRKTISFSPHNKGN